MWCCTVILCHIISQIPWRRANQIGSQTGTASKIFKIKQPVTILFQVDTTETTTRASTHPRLGGKISNKQSVSELSTTLYFMNIPVMEDVT